MARLLFTHKRHAKKRISVESAETNAMNKSHNSRGKEAEEILIRGRAEQGALVSYSRRVDGCLESGSKVVQEVEYFIGFKF